MMAGNGAANSMSPVIKPQDQLGPQEANHGCYQASVEQCPPEGFWYSTFHEPINLRNSGSTPASEVQVALSIWNGDIARDFEFALGIIDPAADAHHTAYFEDEWITALDIPNVRVELKINYSDAFGRKWERNGKYTPLGYVPNATEVSFHFSVKDGSSREAEKR
jgi:hypothetical protein